MAGTPVKTGDFWRINYETRKYKEWVTALSETWGDGFHKRRSNSAPAEERGHHPHIHHILNQSLNNLTSQPLEASRRENIQAALFDYPGRCPHERSGYSNQLPTSEKDVDGCQPKMRETSGSERKPKKHQHSGDHTLPVESEYGLSTHSVEEIAALPSNIEDEGVVTSCKRVKLSAPQIKKFHHNSVFEPLSHSKYAAARSVVELGDPSDHLTLDGDPTFVNIDGEARERKQLSGSGVATKRKATGRDFLDRYKGPANNFPDYGYTSSVRMDPVLENLLTEHLPSPPAIQISIELAPGKNKIMAREKKTSIPGSFRPFNNLKHSDKSPSILPRPNQKKVFDLHESNSTRASDESRATKRQKLGTENLLRRESSGSIIEISGDGNNVRTGRNISSTSSTPNKTIQSVSPRSRYQNPQFVSRLGEVDEYNRTEAIVGFAKVNKRKVLLTELQRRISFRGEIESATRQRQISLMPESPIFTNGGTLHASANSGGKSPILVDDLEPEEAVELSQAPKVSQGETRNTTPRPAASNFSANVEKSHYFVKPERRGRAKSGIPHTDWSIISSEGVEAQESDEASSPGSFHSLGDAADEAADLEGDTIDLVRHDSDSRMTDHEAESRAGVQNKILKPSGSPKSKSISEEGDIPQSKFSGVRAKHSQGQISQTSKSELSFEITYLQSGQKLLEVEKGYQPWKLQYDYDKKEFNVIVHGLSLHEDYPALVLKPEKIHVVKYSNKSSKVVISRAMETSISAAAQVLVEMNKVRDGNRLAQSLKKLNHTIKLSPFGSGERLDNIFIAARRSTPLPSYQPKDIGLLTVKEARRAAANDNMREIAINSEHPSTGEEWNHSANVGRRRSSTSEQGNPDLTRRQSIASRMQPNSLHDFPVAARVPQVVLPARDELSTSNRLSTMNGEEFYGSRPATRASSWHWNGERQTQRLKSRSPSPLRWTTQNPGWKEEQSWENSLTFPKEGKKKATVDARDIERLDEGEFLNDNLIAFYLRFLEDGLEKRRPELARRIYFHNTFFYETLTKGKVRSNNINYDAVKRWTSKVDLFSYDYIVVPVCEKLHWYVAIICNAPRLVQADTPEIVQAQDTSKQQMLAMKTSPGSALEAGNDDRETSKTLDNSNEATEPKSASPSVIAQVEHMSLEDQEPEWPEPDAVPDVPHSRIAQLRGLRTAEKLNDDLIVDDEFKNQVQNQDIRPKSKKLKRKSIPPARRYDPSDPRIITLDSLGQAHSPTCSNLKEYLVCEAKERHNVDIVPVRLGMTAKGLPQQSNYCDCGVFALGYIEEFLKNPDEFIYNILQGDVAGNRAGIKIEASEMRGEIRELIFHLHAEQIQDGKGRHECRSKSKKVSNTEAERKPHLANRKSATTAETAAEPDGSESTEEIDSRSLDTSRAKRSAHFSKRATTPITRTEDSEIMETPVPSVEDEPNLALEKAVARKRDSLSSPNSNDRSIPLDSPLHPASSEGNWLTSPNHKAEGGSRRHNTFKEFAKNPDSPFQNTRHKTRHEKSSEYIPLEINDTQDGRQLEIRETPPRQREREPSFEDLLELTAKYRKSKTFVLDAVHSPESKVLRRKEARH